MKPLLFVVPREAICVESSLEIIHVTNNWLRHCISETKYSILIISRIYAISFLFQSCCFASDGMMLLEISLMVRMENMQHEFVDLRQYLLENLFVVYVAVDKTQTSGRSKFCMHVPFPLYFFKCAYVCMNFTEIQLNFDLCFFSLVRRFSSNLVCVAFRK